ncbi:MAG: ABC transporter permease [Spirochaetes bacterium]|nr:ABC transporter permease [Spirochaetota bacterium]
MKNIIQKIGIPRLMIGSLFLLFLAIGGIRGMDIVTFLSDVILRVGMNGLLVLAILPSIQSGSRPNFAISIGIICGLLGIILSIEMGIFGIPGLFVAAAISIPFAIIAGYFYGRLLNLVKGQEMTIATFMGFAIVQFMCIGWIILPVKSGIMKWALGKGLRNVFPLDKTFGKVLNDFLYFEIGNLRIPTGLLLTFFGVCFLVWIFTKTKTGTEMLAGGMNPKFAEASGVNINRNRITANILSTIIAAIGIIVFSQSINFVQLYVAPLYMPFPAVAAILIGGATASRAKVSHVIIGVFLFQGLLVVSQPVLNDLTQGADLSEIIRMVTQNGIILYALTKVKGNG